MSAKGREENSYTRLLPIYPYSSIGQIKTKLIVSLLLSHQGIDFDIVTSGGRNSENMPYQPLSDVIQFLFKERLITEQLNTLASIPITLLVNK